MAFTIIETQEQFDEAIKERLKRERETSEQKYADYGELKSAKELLEKQFKDLNDTLTATNEKYAGYDKNIAELNGKIKDFEIKALKSRIANESGIPLELAGRLSGETEEEIKKDAESLSGLVIKKQTLPLKATEPSIDDEKAPYKEILNNLKS